MFSEFGGHPTPNTIFANFDGQQFHIGPHINLKIHQDFYADIAALCWHVTDVLRDAAKALFAFDPEEHFPVELERYLNSWTGIAPPPPSPRT